MTGRVSDNPADSLRRELDPGDFHSFDCDRFNVYGYGARQGDCDCTAAADIRAALKAARADERERLQRENQELRAEVERLKERTHNAEVWVPKLDSQSGSLTSRLGITRDPVADAKLEADMKAIRDAERSVDLNRVIGGAVSDGN